MKHFSNVVFSLTLLLSAAFNAAGQSQGLAGFVFANAVGISGKADVSANGKKLTRSGLEPGMATSGLGLPVGNYQLQVSAPGCESATAPLSIAAGTTPVVVAYLQRELDPRTHTVKNFIRLLQLPCEPQDQRYVIKVISVDAGANFTATTSSQVQQIKPLIPAIFEAKAVKITDSTGSTEEAQVSNRGSYYCFAFLKADGKPGISLALQRIYTW